MNAIVKIDFYISLIIGMFFLARLIVTGDLHYSLDVFGVPVHNLLIIISAFLNAATRPYIVKFINEILSVEKK